MGLTTRVKRIFNENVNTTLQSVEMLAPVIAAAAESITGSLIQERKILACGNGPSATTAQRLVTGLLHRLELERPGLPAVALSSDAATMSAIATDYQFADVYTKQIRAIGQPNDVLVVVASSDRGANLGAAVEAAHDRDMRVIALTGGDGGIVAEHIGDEDIEIRVPALSAVRIEEAHLLITHCLCDLIDHQLLGQEA